MKRKNRLSSYLPFMFALLASVQISSAQSRSVKAVEWYNRGLAEQDPQNKIEAYSRAVEEDQNFVEALHNLGAVYRKQRNFEQAKKYLSKALAAKAQSNDDRLKAAILQELAMVHQGIGDLKASEAALRQATELSIDNEVKANVYFRLGKLLFDRNRYKEAKTEFENGRRLTNTRQSYFENYIHFAQRSIYHTELYEEATRDLDAGDLQGARDKLTEIVQERADFLDVADILPELESRLAVEQDKMALSALYDQALEHESREELVKAIATYRRILQQDSTHLQAKLRLENARQRLEESKAQETVQQEYVAGIDAFQNSNWSRAILAFEKVQELEPGFRDTPVLLEEAKRKLELLSEESVVARYYFDGLGAMNNGDFGGALFAFEKVISIDPDYKNVSSLIESIEQNLQQRYQHALGETGAIRQVDSLYQQSISAIEDENWAQVIELLERIQRQQPDYRDVPSLLSFARASHEQQASTGDHTAARNGNSPNVLLLGGIIAVLIVLPLAGYVAFSPVARARLMLMRGEYGRATRIYERLLEKKPNGLKHYVPLAHLYLLTGRKDEQALKVYRKILQLNLARDRHEEISAIVAQNYLQDGKQNAESVQALESALDWQYRLNSSHQNDEVS